MTEAPSTNREVFIVDDEPAIREVLSTVFERAGFRATCFAEGTSLLASAHAQTPACIILDVNIPGRSGLDILRQLNAEEYPAPIFVMSGQGDIPMAVEAIRNGALDFIEKPFRGNDVVERVKESMAAWRRRQDAGMPSFVPGLNLPSREALTSRERDVLARIVAGASNKEAGRELGISPRTIEVHRARIIEKVGAKNTADLIRIVMSRQSSSATAKAGLESSG